MRISSYIVTHKSRTQRGVLQACKILSNPARYQILRLLFAARAAKKEICVGEIAQAIGMSQSATSHQLALLEAHGIVVGEKMGQTTCYDLTDSPLANDIEKIIHIGK
jgi:DNA-binding transcriptional ArsR family regulator